MVKCVVGYPTRFAYVYSYVHTMSKSPNDKFLRHIPVIKQCMTVCWLQKDIEKIKFGWKYKRDDEASYLGVWENKVMQVLLEFERLLWLIWCQGTPEVTLHTGELRDQMAGLSAGVSMSASPQRLGKDEGGKGRGISTICCTRLPWALEFSVLAPNPQISITSLSQDTYRAEIPPWYHLTSLSPWHHWNSQPHSTRVGTLWRCTLGWLSSPDPGAGALVCLTSSTVGTHKSFPINHAQWSSHKPST